MSKIFWRTTLAVITFLTVTAPLLVDAAGAPNSPGPIFANPIRFGSVKELLEEVFKLVGYLGAIAAIFFFIYAGFLYVTAGGEPGKIEKAHKTFINTAIGTAILLGASLIVTVLQNTINNIRGN